MLRSLSLLPLALLLPGCGGDDGVEPQAPRDPQVAQALDDPLMTDPDLSSRNEGAAALTVEVDDALPVLPASPESVGAARAEAARMVGGADRLTAVPPPAGNAPALRDRSAAAHLAALEGGARCGEGLRGSTVWAARLPDALLVYPRGATAAAAGSDDPGCKARVVGFTTPVPLAEVLAFYWARARAARLEPVHRMSAEDHVLSGGEGGLAFDLRANRQGGVTVVRLATLQR